LERLLLGLGLLGLVLGVLWLLRKLEKGEKLRLVLLGKEVLEAERQDDDHEEVEEAAEGIVPTPQESEKTPVTDESATPKKGNRMS
jgi:hypothetical protein